MEEISLSIFERIFNEYINFGHSHTLHMSSEISHVRPSVTNKSAIRNFKSANRNVLHEAEVCGEEKSDGGTLFLKK